MTRPKHQLPLAPAERSALQSRAGKQARKASPWNRGPNCAGKKAKQSYERITSTPRKDTAA